MAGHENSLVRPKTAQDPLKIAAGSPLAIQGIFLEILRERFAENANVGLIWRPDVTTTDILIEVSYNEETESRSQTPALYVTKLDTIPAKIMLGDRAGVHLPDHKEGFGTVATVNMSIDCVSNDEGESSLLGDLVQYTFLSAQDVIQREFGFYDFSSPALSQTQPYDRDTTKWITAVQFQVQFWIRWSQVPIAPLLQEITQKLTHSGNASFFSDSALMSFRRGQTKE